MIENKEPIIRGISIEAEENLLKKIYELHQKEIQENDTKFRKDQQIFKKTKDNKQKDELARFFGGDEEESFRKSENPDQPENGLSHSVLVAPDGNWYILPHRQIKNEKGKMKTNPDRIGRGGEHEVRRVYRVIWPNGENSLPSLSTELYLVKESQFNPEKENFDEFLEKQKRKTDAIREHEDPDAVEIWKPTGQNKTSDELNLNDKHYVILKGFEGKNIDQFKEGRDFSHVGLPVGDGLDMAIGILSELEKLHEAGKIHGDLSERNILYDEKTKEVHLVDFTLSTPFGTPVLGGTEGIISPEVLKKQRAGEIADAHPSQDIYALGAHGGLGDSVIGSLSYPSSYYYDFYDDKEKDFKNALNDLFLRHYLGAKDPDKRPTAKEAKEILSNFKHVYDNEIEYAKFLKFHRIFSAIEKKKDDLMWHTADTDDKWNKVRALSNLQDVLAQGFLRCYLYEPGTAEYDNAFNQFTHEIRQKDWRSDPETKDLFAHRSVKGVVADVVLGLCLGGFLVMLVKATIAAIQGKSFRDNFSLFGKPSSVEMMEQITHEEVPSISSMR